MPLPNFLDQFALGMALAVLSVRGLPERFQAAVRRAWPWWLLAGVAYWAMCTQIGLEGVLSERAGPREFILRHEMGALVAAALLVPAIFSWREGGGVRRLLAWRPLLYVGLVSYGVYLWHLAVVNKIAKGTAEWMRTDLGLGVDARFFVLFALAALGSVAIATVSYRLVERPALKLKRFVGPPPERQQPGEALGEPAPATTLRRG
jgi:peptidoglycan/LPS O-acetylase OafA/YrhL